MLHCNANRQCSQYAGGHGDAHVNPGDRQRDQHHCGQDGDPIKIERVGKQSGNVNGAVGRMRAQRQCRIHCARQHERYRGSFQHQPDIVENVRARQRFDQLGAGGYGGAAVAEIDAGQYRSTEEHRWNLHGSAQRHRDHTHRRGRSER